MSDKISMWVKRIIIALLAYFFALSLNHIISLRDGGYSSYGVGLFGYNIWAVGLYIFSAWILYRMLYRNDKRLHLVCGGVGLLLSMAIVYGSYVHLKNDIFISGQVIVSQIGLVFGFLPMAIALSEELVLLLDKLPKWYAENVGDAVITSDRFFTKKRHTYFLIVWLFIFVAYLPIFLCWWPGNFVYDAPFQMREIVYGNYTTHHPLLHTLLLGWAYKLGLEMGDVSTGYQFYTLVQMAILAGAFAFCSTYFYEKRAPKTFCVGVVLWFALFPLHAVFAISCTKDVLFAAFFLCFIIYIVRLVYDKEQFRWNSYLGLILCGVLSVLMRNNAVYAIIAGGFFIILFMKDGWKARGRIIGVLVAVYFGSGLANLGLVLATGAQDTDSYRESLSVPLQCFARVVTYRGGELDQALYDEICAYVPEEDLYLYNPYLSDEVKENANEILLRENFLNFTKLWIKVGLKFPDEYIESVLANTMGYWYPLDQGAYTVKPIEFFHKLMWISDEIEKRDYFPLAGEFYGYLFWQEKWRTVPILGYLCRLDCWVWFVNYFLAWCVYKKNRYAGLVGGIPLMYLGTCYLGPVPILRYIYCIIVIVPVLISMVMRQSEKMEGIQ